MDKPNRSNLRHTKPLQGLFEQKPTGILAMGVHILCADKKIREVEMNPKLADKILGLIKHVHGGAINVSAHTLEMYLIPPPEPEPVSRGEGVDAYVPLARQLMWREMNACWRCGYVELLLPTDNKDCPLCRGVATLQQRK